MTHNNTNNDGKEDPESKVRGNIFLFHTLETGLSKSNNY